MTDTPTPSQDAPDIARPFESFMVADDRPRPPNQGTGLLTADQARRLAQASVDAGSDPAAIKEALARDGIVWDPDTRTPSERQWAADFDPNDGARYTVPADRYFAGDDPAEIGALSDVVRTFVGAVGLDRSGGNEMAETIVRTAAELRGARREVRAQYAASQLARLGDKAPSLVADAARALQGVHPDVLAVMHRSGALDNADVLVQLAHVAQARAARG